jgi:hypothetical protein
MAAYPVTTADQRQAASKRANTQVLKDDSSICDGNAIVLLQLFERAKNGCGSH